MPKVKIQNRLKALIFLFLLSISYNLKAQNVSSIKRIIKDSVVIDLINPFLCPIEFSFKPKNEKNISFNYKSEILIKANDTNFNVFKFPLSVIKDTSKIDINEFVESKGSFGDSKSIKLDKDFLFKLPFPKNKKYKVIQSFGGKFSHNLPHSKFAIDFNLEIGDTITAARNGKVFYVKEDSKKHGKTRDFIKYANKINILHDDGTIADYAHIDFNGALVEVGDYVEAGQPIALSGLTGFTTTPHLHFVVFKGKNVSFPIYFEGYKNKILRKNSFYYRK
ncbi:M23 family metallopeptidase [Litoribaculum gwangyangense]|uniref:M23ase beta-sheet core domain-containing protein n=1 Tax=Litoribaculum gwangyangense TaxID=1130722 RepID=A0ABP9CRT8_9FLAO